MTKADTLKPGDTVEWTTSQGKIRGHVVKEQTGDTQIKGHKVKASKAQPQFIVESDKTGAWAAHRPDALKKRAG